MNQIIDAPLGLSPLIRRAAGQSVDRGTPRTSNRHPTDVAIWLYLVGQRERASHRERHLVKFGDHLFRSWRLARDTVPRSACSG